MGCPTTHWSRRHALCFSYRETRYGAVEWTTTAVVRAHSAARLKMTSLFVIKTFLKGTTLAVQKSSNSSFVLETRSLTFWCRDSRVTLGSFWFCFVLFWSIFWQAVVEVILGLLLNKVLPPLLPPWVLRLMFFLLHKRAVDLSQGKLWRPLSFPSQIWTVQ